MVNWKATEKEAMDKYLFEHPEARHGTGTPSENANHAKPVEG